MLARALACLLALTSSTCAQSLHDTGWSGNFAINPGFEEDFVNSRAENSTLSFKGDWYYNQQDLMPDYWGLREGFGPGTQWTWLSDSPRSGSRCLKLGTNVLATQSYPGVAYQRGGGSWSVPGPTPIAVADSNAIAQPWRASAWVRNGGAIRLGTAQAKAAASSDWQLLTVELPAASIRKLSDPMPLVLVGPGEFDDIVVQERLPGSPNLIPNAGFESSDASGHPDGWSRQRKYHAIGPTYYTWTDWNHAFRDNRGAVTVDRLIRCEGRQSLRFDVYPGDEKYVESDPITLNQTACSPIEVGVYVRADRIRLFDIRCVNQDGADLPGYLPMQSEYGSGGSATWGNGTFEWRYVRKFFAPAFDQPTRSFRVRLCARGFNGHTLDDSGTRSPLCQVGTLWWDGLHVAERGTDAAALRARGATPQPEAAAPGPQTVASIDLGERLYGRNMLTLSVTNDGAAGTFKARLTTAIPGQPPVVTESPGVHLAANRSGKVEVPYMIGRPVGDLKEQGRLRVELSRDGQMLADTTYSFNTWPVVIDFDVARSYSLPNESPVSVSMNLGVGRETLKQVTRVDLALARAADPRQTIEQMPPIADLPAAFARTLAGLPKTKAGSFEFGFPAPGWWADRMNLLMLNVDLSRLKVWPHDNPTRDTILVARGIDAGGKTLFEGQSDPFCRMQAPPRQPPIDSVAIREDGAVLINGQPRFLTGLMMGNQRFDADDPKTLRQLGVMGHRLWGKAGSYFESQIKMFDDYGLYALQTKPVDIADLHRTPDAIVELDDDQKRDFADFVQAGGMRNTVSVNTGGWEARIPDTPEARAKHQAVNDWIRAVARRPVACSPSGAYNAWGDPMDRPYYDILFAETEMWGPMDYNTVAMPHIRRAKSTPTAWVYLPQLYDNTPYERYRFETYENIIRGAAGVAMIHGTGDPTFTRGLAGELRRLEAPLNSLEEAPVVTFEPDVSHKVTHYKGKTYVLATSCGPIIIGNWTWNKDTKQSGTVSHEGDTVNTMWFRPNGIRIHGFRGMPMPELIRRGDKIVQYVWLDPAETPDWAMVAVRGNGRFSHNAVLGRFDFGKFKADYGNIIMFSELNHSVWHQINWVFDPEIYNQSVKLMGQAWADTMRKSADEGRARVEQVAYQAEHFHALTDGSKPTAGQWLRIELDAEAYGLVGKLVDGFAYLTQNGRALWDYSALERGGKVVRVFCEDTVGIDRALLASVRISVPGLKLGSKVKALFEDREIVSQDGFFTDSFEGTDTYQYEGSGPEGDLFGYVKDPNRELPRMMPAGYGYKYGPTAVRTYEIP